MEAGYVTEGRSSLRAAPCLLRSLLLTTRGVVRRVEMSLLRRWQAPVRISRPAAAS